MTKNDVKFGRPKMLLHYCNEKGSDDDVDVQINDLGNKEIIHHHLHAQM